MKHNVISYHLEVVEERSFPEATYRLLRLEDKELLKFAVEIADRSGRELALLHGKDAPCRAFFEQIVRGELSSIQLSEVAEDFSRAYAPEIF